MHGRTIGLMDMCSTMLMKLQSLAMEGFGACYPSALEDYLCCLAIWFPGLDCWFCNAKQVQVSVSLKVTISVKIKVKVSYSVSQRSVSFTVTNPLQA
jgi:hypothetical protein